MLLVNEKLPRFIEEELLPDFHPGTVYHYTTIDVLGEFFKKDGDLYCTHCQALNDDEEFLLGLNYAKKFIVSRYQVDSRTMINFVERFYTSYKDKWRQPWIMSFSTEKDSLVQWVSYSDRQRGGYAIGFDFAKLKKYVQDKMLSSKEDAYIYILPCVYIEHKRGDQQVQMDEIANRLLAFLLEPYKESIEDTLRTKRSWDGTIVQSIILLFASMVKNASFRHEAECRLIIQPVARSRALSRYRILGQKPRLPTCIFGRDNRLSEIVKSIGISPHGNRRLLTVTAEMCAQANGKRDIKIYSSGSSYIGG